MIDTPPLSRADRQGSRRHAPGDGPSVVLLHGASGCAETWRPVLPHWDWADVWCVDLPGRGGSQAHPPRAEVAALAGWLAALLDAAGLSQPILVGHSLGGAVALTLALQDPARLRGLVLASSSARLRVAPARLAAAAAATAAPPRRRGGGGGPPASAGVGRRYHDRSAAVPPAAGLADWQACDAFDVRDRLGAVGCPTLVVYGAADALTPPRHQHTLAAAIPGATEAEVPVAGHMLPWEDPAGLSAAVRRWAQET